MSPPTVNWRDSAPGGVPAADGFTAPATPTRVSADAPDEAQAMHAARTAMHEREFFMVFPCLPKAALRAETNDDLF
jgi:hypothetical protein